MCYIIKGLASGVAELLSRAEAVDRPDGLIIEDETQLRQSRVERKKEATILIINPYY